ncbi:MAG: hypothetical protein IJP33_02900 [Firmicutes bacterium]|nr:hypothetical protein [Bacillota bacterium]
MSLLTTITNTTLLSLLIGFIIGFFAQRSRMCFIGGWRDFFIIRDTYLLKGFFSFLFAAAFFFFIFHFNYYLSEYPWFARPPLSFSPIELNPFEVVIPEAYRNMSYCDLLQSPVILTVGEDLPIRGLTIFNITIPNELLLTLGATLILGFFSTLANGCPMRQHVMASSGNITSAFYLIGFYAAIVVYDKYIVPIMNELVNIYQ